VIETDAGTKPAAAATGACHPHLSRPPPAAVAWPPSMHTIHTLPGLPASVPDIACGWPPGAGAPGELALDVRVAYPWGPPLVFHPKFCVRGNDPIDHGQSERQHRGWRRCVGVRNRGGAEPGSLLPVSCGLKRGLPAPLQAGETPIASPTQVWAAAAGRQLTVAAGWPAVFGVSQPCAGQCCQTIPGILSFSSIA
jgi:hypothetical protein